MNFYSHNLKNPVLSGYTLIDLLLVVAIMGMAIALIIPRFSSTHTAILKAQTREVVAILKQARRSAIMEGRQVTAVLQNRTDATGGSQGSSSKTWRSDAEVKLQWNEDKTLNSEDESVENAHYYRFTFYPEGGSSGGELILSYKGQRAKIKVNPLTGKVATEFLNRESS